MALATERGGGLKSPSLSSLLAPYASSMLSLFMDSLGSTLRLLKLLYVSFCLVLPAAATPVVNLTPPWPSTVLEFSLATDSW